MDVGQPSIDQLRTFLTVVEEGSFSRAARRLGRAVSAMSYGIANLEAQLGVVLFDRQGSRRPELTEAGRALLSEARAIAGDVDALMAKVRSLRQGLEPELAIAVDVMVPVSCLAALLREFERLYPSVPLRLHIEALGAVAAMVVENRVGFAVAGPDIVDHPDLEREMIGSVELIPVAAPSHPLARAGKLAAGAVRKHLQLVLTDRSDLTEGQDFSVYSTRSWRLGDLGAKHALLKEGIGWGNMPLHAVEHDLASGALVRLDLPERRRITYELNALWRRDAPPGPAALWTLDAFRERLAGT